MTSIRLANLNAYKLTPADRDTPGWEARVTAIREIAPDILALQEVVVDDTVTPPELWHQTAAELIQDLAVACGLTAAVDATPGHPYATAAASNSHRPWYTAILWNPATVTPVPHSFRPYGAPDFWHGFTTLQFDIGAASPLLIASYHADPFRPNARADEALRIKGVFRRTGGVKPGVLLGDFNGLSAAEVIDPDGTRRYYDAECYRDQDHDDLEYQVLAGSAGGENLADRWQTEILLRRGFMVDSAAHLGAPWEATVGHWPDGQGDPDPWGPRRIDHIFATRQVAPALRSYRLHRSSAALAASDHLSPVLTVSPDKIATGS